VSTQTNEQQGSHGVPDFGRAPGEAPRTMGEAWKEFEAAVAVQEETPKQERAEASGESVEKKQSAEAGKSGAKPDAKPRTEAEGDGKPAKADAQRENQTPQQKAYDRLLDRASKEPDFDKVVERLHEPFFPMSQEGYARYQVMAHAMSQVSNSEDVLYFLARPENSEIAFKMQEAPPHKIAAVIHTISAELRFGVRGKRADSPRPRAPKPPTEVGGRGATPSDEVADAVRRNDFKAFEAAEWRRKS
jgi:hypothetical protein